MKLGTETGSLINHLAARATGPLPEVGMGATILAWTDRHAATIIYVSASRKLVRVQHDNSRRTDNNGAFTEAQSYEYSRNPRGIVETFRLGKRGWRAQGGGFGLLIGHREEYRDPHL
jgi:hypothetical protein